ncbi:MAG: hypothetical protein LBK58_15210 [Prevotellaceae bacterium]|jgi:hypothetical protein|nr:hypothetical protein [Prevotellaceae bacterium]
MKTIIQIILGVIVVVLAYMLYDSLMEPIRFNKAVEYRSELVVQRLKHIRDLQVAYKDCYGRYSGGFDTLINFYKNDSLKIVKQVGSWDDSVAIAKKLVYTDTIRIAVKDSMFRSVADFSVDSLAYVPVVHEPFDLQAISYMSISKVTIPLFEAGVHNDVFLKGLDRQSIVNLNDKDKEMNRYPGIKVGSVTQPNNNAGNWE